MSKRVHQSHCSCFYRVAEADALRADLAQRTAERNVLSQRVAYLETLGVGQIDTLQAERDGALAELAQRDQTIQELRAITFDPELIGERDELRADLAQRTAELERLRADVDLHWTNLGLAAEANERLRSQVDNCQANAHYRAWQESQSELQHAPSGEQVECKCGMDGTAAEVMDHVGRMLLLTHNATGDYHAVVPAQPDLAPDQRTAVERAYQHQVARLRAELAQTSDYAHKIEEKARQAAFIHERVLAQRDQYLEELQQTRQTIADMETVAALAIPRLEALNAVVCAARAWSNTHHYMAHDSTVLLVNCRVGLCGITAAVAAARAPGEHPVIQ